MLRKLVCMAACFILPSLSIASEISVYHNNSRGSQYESAWSPDGKHFAASDNWGVSIWDNTGAIVGEYLEKKPRIAMRKEWRFWNIYRSTTAPLAFINNEELAIVQDEKQNARKIIITGLDGIYKREYILPGKNINEMGTHEDNKQGRKSNISAIRVSPDGQTIVTFEPHGYFIFIRDKNFREIKGIRLDPTANTRNWFTVIQDVKFMPDNSGFIIQSEGEAIKGGWISTLTLYDMKGNQVRGLFTDKPLTSIDSTYGKIPYDPINTPKEWDISPDGKYIVWIDFNPKIDKKLLGKYKVEDIHPKGSFREYPYSVYIGIRRIEIATAKQHLAVVLKGGDVTLQNAEERKPFTDPGFTSLFFSRDSREYTGIASTGIYRISLDGKIISWKENPIDEEYTQWYKRRMPDKHYTHPIRLSDAKLSPDRTTFIANPYFMSIDATLRGRIGRSKTALNYTSGEEPLRVSHDGRFISLEIERGADSILWDTKSGSITREKSSIFWDNKNREYRMSKGSAATNIEYSNGEIVLSSRYRTYQIFPFPDGTAAISDSGLVMLDREGNPDKKHPRSTYYLAFAMHPSLNHYLVPNVDAKVKTMVKVAITGQRISEFWIGSFITNVRYSPDGTRIIGAHSESGCTLIWDENGNQLDYPGMIEKRFLDVHPEFAKGIAMTKDNRFLISSTEQAIYIVDLKTGKRAKASIYFRYNEEKDTEFDFIVSDSDGRFECTDNVKHMVSITERGRNSTDRLWKKQFTSGLLWKFMQGQ